jgi:hypothetical protein
MTDNEFTAGLFKIKNGLSLQDKPSLLSKPHRFDALAGLFSGGRSFESSL